MIEFEALTSGIVMLFSPFSILMLVTGVTWGLIVGILPGLGAPLAVTLALPFTFYMEPVYAFSLLLGSYNAAVYGGSITAITLAIPGSGAAAATLIDGNAKFLRGEGGEALGISLMSSVFGGLFSALCLLLIAPILASFALRFGPREYLALAIFGVIIVGKVSGNDIWKGLAMACLGLFLTFIGIDPITGVERFRFGSVYLYDGIPLVPLLLGLYAFSEILIYAEEVVKSDAQLPRFRLQVPGLWRMRKHLATLFRASGFGTLIGLIPGQGATIAAFFAYGDAKRRSKTPEAFGKGAIEGIVAPEAANNATIGGALIPTLTLGIPGSVVAAILMGALAMHGFSPGPRLFEEAPDLMYAIFVGLFVVNLLLLIIGNVVIRLTSRLLQTPMYYIMPVIVLLCFIGAYATTRAMFGVYVMLIAGLVGYIFRKLDFPVVPLVLGFVIGELIEVSFRQSLVYTNGNWITFVQSPIAVGIYILLVVSMLGQRVSDLFRRHKKMSE